MSWRALIVSLAGVLAAGVAGCGAASSSSSTTAHSRSSAQAGAISVTPRRGTPATSFAVRFTAPDAAGVVDHEQIGYSVALTGPVQEAAGCVGERSVPAAAPAGASVTVSLDPAQLGGVWCAGRHGVRVVETAVPVCHPGTMCPQYMRLIRTVGTTSFTVSGAV